MFLLSPGPSFTTIPELLQYYSLYSLILATIRILPGGALQPQWLDAMSTLLQVLCQRQIGEYHRICFPRKEELSYTILALVCMCLHVYLYVCNGYTYTMSCVIVLSLVPRPFKRRGERSKHTWHQVRACVIYSRSSLVPEFQVLQCHAVRVPDR